MNGMASSWLPRTLLVSPLQRPQPRRSLVLPTTVVSSALREDRRAGRGELAHHSELCLSLSLSTKVSVR